MVEHRSTGLRYPGGVRSLLGVIAYLLGCAIVFGWKGGSVETAFERTTVEGPYQSSNLAEVLASSDVVVSVANGSGWLFYNAHQIRVSVPDPTGGITRVNLLASAGGEFSLLYLVPPVLLVLAGLFATFRASDVRELRFDLGDTAFRRYWYNGAFPVMFGYMPLAVVGAWMFRMEGFGPDILLGWILAGMVYPFVFAGLGGVLAMERWYR